MNLATRYLVVIGQTMHDYDGLCIDLAGEVVENYGGEAIAYQEDAGPWRFHAAAIIGNEVHDPWIKYPLSLDEWLDHWEGHSLWRSDTEDEE